MPSGNDPREADVEQANSRLNEGLKSCRTVVDNYRAMLAGDHGGIDRIDPHVPTGECDSEAGEDSPDQPGG